MNPSTPKRACLLYWAAFVFSGIGLTLAGPALGQLRERTGTGIGDIGGVFVGTAIGALAGSLLAGQLLNRFNGHRVFTLSALTMAIGLAAVPFLHSLASLMAAFAVTGVGGAALATTGNSLIMWWRQDVARNLTILHLCFGLGAIAAPLAAAVSVDRAYWAAAVALAVAGLSVLSLESPDPKRVRGDDQMAATTGVVMLAAIFFIVYAAFELGYSNWIATYAAERGMSERATSLVNTAFWVAFTAGRALVAFAPSIPRPKVVVGASLAVSVVAALLLVAGRNGTGPLFVIGTVLAGLGAAAQFPTTLSYLDRRINASGRFTSVMVAAAAVGSLVGPWLIGQSIEVWGPAALSLATLSTVVTLTGLFLLLDRRLAGSTEA